ncbi:MAG: hypothetical protein EA384_07920 [Spirochaetaceae bacterium]|nr:MAG: hypothetical protein EA384_07920 [Spirochaetaceae bacterium]
MEMRQMFWIVPFVCSSVLLGLSGCAENEAERLPSGVEASLDETASVSRVFNGSSYRVDLPKRWNGRFMVLFTNGASGLGLDAKSRSLNLTWRNLVAAGYVVAEVNGSASDTRCNPDDGGRLRVHFVLSLGRSKGAYLVGTSLGTEIALMTILIDDVRFYSESNVVSPGFVRPDSWGISAETVEANLCRDEHSAIALGYRLQTERSNLARTLVFYYALLSDLHRDGSAGPPIPDVLHIDTAAILSRLLGSVS